jgi:hypothetical protein
MNIAIVAWGSLIWKLGSLKVTGSWMLDGPILPIEFSRISDNGRLTLVIDEKNGVPVQTRHILSSLGDLPSAVTNLQTREGMLNSNRVGYVDIQRKERSEWACERHASTCTLLYEWAQSKQLDAVIWTALGPRFEERTRESFSPQAALRYLLTLEGDKRDAALEYVREAPAEVRTPVRQLVTEYFWPGETSAPTSNSRQ